jgi:nitrous oxide reductase accessory protein NosL
MSRFPTRTARPARVHACMSETMPPPVDPAIRRAVQTVYTTDLGLPEEWTEAQRADFIDAEIDKITWMARADAATLGERSIHDWARRHGGQLPNLSTQSALRAQARAQGSAPCPRCRAIRTHPHRG